MDQTLGHLIEYIAGPTANFIFAKSPKEKEMKHHCSTDARKKNYKAQLIMKRLGEVQAEDRYAL